MWVTTEYGVRQNQKQTDFYDLEVDGFAQKEQASSPPICLDRRGQPFPCDHSVPVMKGWSHCALFMGNRT